MYFRLIFLTAFVFAFACNTPSPEGQKTEATPSADSVTAETEQAETPASTTPSFNAFIAGNNVRARKQPSTQSEIVFTYEAGIPVKIMRQVGERVNITKGDECDDFGYYWYETEDEKQNHGFIFGKFLFQTHPENIRGPWYTTVPMQGQDWGLGVAKDLSYGSMGEDGLTGCEELIFPYLYLGNESMVFPIYVNNQTVSNHGGWMRNSRFDSGLFFLLHSSEGTEARLESFRPLGSERGFDIEIFFQHQEEEERIIFRVIDFQGKFMVDTWSTH
ncbi:MAG: SH3 domain-containing protein [Bacteroidia bacterium]